MKFLSLSSICCSAIIFCFSLFSAQESAVNTVIPEPTSSPNPSAQENKNETKEVISAPEASATSLASAESSIPLRGSPRKLRDVATIKTDDEKTKAEIPEQETIDFNFENTELEEMVRRYTEKKKLNVVFPQAGLKEKITFRPPHKLSMDEAKRYLYMFLDYAGYSVLPGQNFVVVAKSTNAPRSQLPLYVMGAGSKLNYKDLPETDEIIRAVYYLSTLKVDNDQNNAVAMILKEVLTPYQNTSGTQGPYPDNVFVDTTLNGIVIADKARVIKSALHLLSDLDATEPKYIITTIQLFNASAQSVVTLIKDQLLATSRQSGGFGQDDKQSGGMGTYFSTSIRVVADQRRNLLIIMGKEAPVNRLKDFIRESLDAPLESGKSLFHVYNLKYLDAATFADTLSNVVKASGIGDQASADRTGGTTRFFEGVSIKAETFQAAEAGRGGDMLSSAGGGSVYRGGNRLLIAAQPSDWQQIKKLIDQLDIPQKQVIVEVLIADYTRAREKDLSSHIRSPHAMVPTSGGGAIQTTNDGGGIITSPTSCNITGSPNPCPPPPPASAVQTNIYGDLMRQLSAGASELSGLTGYTAITFADNTGVINDGASKGIWGLITILDQCGKLKILQHPYLISLNNQPATITSQEIRRGNGDISSATGGAVNINVVDIPATLTVSITPRIASLNRLNLDINIDISNYTSSSGFDRNTRKIQTNVNMNGKNQILVLGGLTRFDETDDVTQTPLLSKIPLIGWLFKGKAKTRVETELGVFIKPTVIEPKIREPANKYTDEKIEIGSKNLFNDIESPSDKRDPIIRWFFVPEKTDQAVMKEFLTETGAQQSASEKVDAEKKAQRVAKEVESIKTK